MACTLEELQAVEYDIMCHFADFCDKYNINYQLSYGTLLGAIRHNGFIPWDDDVDVIMSLSDFNKFKRKIKKDPIDGYDFCWIDNKNEFYPFYFAKIRKRGTYMPEPALRELNIDTGVWIDIFVYICKPKTNFGNNTLGKAIGIFQMIGEKYVNKVKREKGNDVISSSALYRFIDKCPDLLLKFIRRFLFALIIIFENKNSEYAFDFNYVSDHSKLQKKNFFEPTILHKFSDKDFKIPENYDDLLRFFYGDDYMTPIKSHIHAHLEEIEL